MRAMFHSQQFDCTRLSSDTSVSKDFQQVGRKDLSNKVDHGEVAQQVASDIESFGSGICFFQLQSDLGLPMSQHQIYQQQNFKELVDMDDLYLNVVSPPFQLCEDEIKKVLGIEAENTKLNEPKKRRSYVFPSESFKVLTKYQSRRRLKLDCKSSSTCYGMQSTHAHARVPLLPTETTIKLAAEKSIHSMSQRGNEFSVLNHPFQSSVLAHSGEDDKGVQLVQNLLYCAEKVAENQYEHAIKFLKECDKMSSRTGTPIQRLVFYFSEALFEKIAVETGKIRPKDLEKLPIDPGQLEMYNMPLHIAFNKEYPLAQITKLVGIQAVLEHLEEARKVHVIDLEIRTGVHWITLMQALAARNERPIEQLKITAVGTNCKLMMEETGRQLASFAHSLNLKFTFKIVFVEDILDLNQNLFDLNADESVAVYAFYTLKSMVGRVDRLNHLMKVMRNMNPCVMIVTEIETNCNSPTFIGRFVESLFFYGALFDSLAHCFKNDDTSRENVESIWFRSSIRNVLAAEGEQRKIRHVNITVWRAFFARLGLVEIELSILSLDQARLGLQSLPCGSSFTLYRDGKCLTLGWKGTPLSSLSAWKFA